MGVRKFRDIVAMNEATESDRRGAGVDWDAVRHVLAMACAGAPRHLEPGVYRHRTVEEWNAQTDAWEREAVERARARSSG